MTSPSVKICGLTRPQDVEAAIRYGAGFLGFIVEAKSARRLTVQAAAMLARPASGTIPTVAVTVNPNDGLLAQITELMRPDYIQLHGDETPERVADIKSKFSTKIIKALPIARPSDLNAILDYDIDLILLDAKAPKGAARGGHGKSFDWGMLKNVALPNRWALAGGLTPRVAARAAEQTKAPILDVSSGVESAPGIKDVSLIQAFMDAVNHG